MPLSQAVITFDASDYTSTDFDARRTKVYATNNVPGGTVIDTVGNHIYLGSGNGTIATDGSGSISVPIPGTGSNPASWQTTIHLDYPDRNARGGRGTRSFGPFTITASADLADLVEELEVPPEYAGALVAEMQALRDETAAISGLTGEDDTVALLVGTPSSDTATALARGVGVVSARTHGVTADGTTDDTTALQAVIDAVATLGAGSVLLPRGTIVVSDEIVVPEHVWLTAESPGGWENYGVVNAGTTIRLADSSGLTASQGVVRFEYQGTETTERRHQGGMVGITVDGNRTTNAANSGIVMAGVRFIHLERVHAVRCGLHGFSAVTDGTATSEMSFVATFAGFNGGSGYRLFGGDSTLNGAMAGVNDGDGFYLGLAATVCTGLSSWNNKRDGLVIASAAATQHLSVVGGQFYDNDRAGITVESPGANSMLGNSIVGASVHGNGRQDFVTYASAIDRVGIRVVGVHTPAMLAIHGVTTGNRTYTLPTKFQEYGVALQTAGCNPTVSGVSGTENNVALWYLVDATAIPENQAGRLVPIKDNVFSIGRSALRWLSMVALRFEVYAAANDAQPRVRVGSTAGAAAIDFGAGGSTSTDVGLVRGAVGILELSNGTTGGGAGAIRLGTSAAKGARLWSGSGAPTTPGAAGISYALGDAYFRTDTPTTANQRLYLVTTAGTSPTWTGVL